jgi:nucleoside-diphosphate-sugar epimerase
MDNQIRKAAVTGATGFIGRAVTRRLAADGWEIKALIRPGSHARRPDIADVTWITGDLEQEGSLTELVSGVHAVVHCAGAVRGACREDFERVNVLGTQKLARICSEQHIPPFFLFISSLAAREPELSYYASSKRKAESVLAESASTVSWTVLRPPAVYGPGDREMLPLFQAMYRGICPIPGDGAGRVSLVHVHDLADAVLHLLNFDKSGNKIYELHDGHPAGYSWHDILKTVSLISGRQIMCIKIPVAIVKMLGLVNIGVSKISGRAPMLTPGKVRELLHPDWTAQNNKISEETGWVPAITLEQGLRELLHS